jgi:hypothetical protein
LRFGEGARSRRATADWSFDDEIKKRLLRRWDCAGHLPNLVATNGAFRAGEIVSTHERDMHAATACFLDDFVACVAHLKRPIDQQIGRLWCR